MRNGVTSARAQLGQAAQNAKGKGRNSLFIAAICVGGVVFPSHKTSERKGLNAGLCSIQQMPLWSRITFLIKGPRRCCPLQTDSLIFIDNFHSACKNECKECYENPISQQVLVLSKEYGIKRSFTVPLLPQNKSLVGFPFLILSGGVYDGVCGTASISYHHTYAFE